MTITLRPILSDPHPESGRPWFDFDIDVSSMTVTIREFNGIAASGLCSLDKEQSIIGTWTLGFDASAPAEQHVLIVTLTGDLSFIPISKQPSVSYAHLAWVNPVTGLVDVIQTVDGTIGDDSLPISERKLRQPNQEELDASTAPVTSDDMPHMIAHNAKVKNRSERLNALRAKGWDKLSSSERDEAASIMFDPAGGPVVVPQLTLNSPYAPGVTRKS